MNWAKSIIEAGYKEVLKAQHPDRFPEPKREAQNRVCQALAVERDRLLALEKFQPCPPGIVPPVPSPVKAENPYTALDELIDAVTGAIRNEVKRTIHKSIPVRRRRAAD